MILDKKGLAATKQNMDLHVLLIMKQENISKAQAQANAYSEGAEGLVKRLNPEQKQLPLSK